VRRSTAPLTAGLLLLAAAPLHAQQPDAEPELTPELARTLVEFHNAPTTSRFTGTVRISAGNELSGDVSVLEGTLFLDGAVDGSVLVLNGSAVLGPAARIADDLVVIGGTVRGDSSAVGGDLLVVPEPLRYRRDGDSISAVIARAEPRPAVSAGRDFGFGRTDLLVTAHGTYNRVEGLPLAIGPRVRFGGSNPTVLDALLLYRTESGITPDLDDLGWLLGVEQFAGGHRRLSLGVTLESDVVPIETTGIRDLEASLATFLLHRDYRDHYQRTGWSAFVQWLNPRRSLRLRAEVLDERHEWRAAGDPLALFDNDEPFRPQPLVGAGDLTSVRLRGEWDTRNEPAEPSSGWWVRADVEQGLAGELELPVRPGAGGVTIAPTPLDEGFSALTVDLRRYGRLGPRSRVAIRVLAAGSIDGEALPPQRQHALGGEGTLPAYSLFELDCAARSETVQLGPHEFFPYYGCDRALLFQASYELSLPFIRPLGRALGWDFDFGAEPAVSVFFDAGRAWTERDAREGRGAGPDDFIADAGIGVRLGRIGVYWAVPLSGREDGVNFFLRLGPRL